MVELERCRRSVLYWAERYAWTRDEKDPRRPFKPLIGGPLAVDATTLRIRPLTDDIDEYLRWLTVIWMEERLIVLPKSRQQRVSWWAIAMLTHLVQFQVAQRVAVQSKQSGDADKLLDRAVVILEQQPKVSPIVPWPAWKKKFGLVTINHGGLMGISRMEGIPQGADKVRGEAYSALFSDEMAFQADAEAAFAAMMPLVEGGARYVSVSSAKGSTFFEQLKNDTI